jgi:hypothetical protein
MTRPCLVTGARLRYDEVREEHQLLIPEGVVRLNATAAEVLELGNPFPLIYALYGRPELLAA